MREAITLIGPPACGKGTQAKLLEDMFEEIHTISTGDLIRKRLGDLSGNYVDDSTIETLINEELEVVESTNDSKRVYVLDGVPRTFAQVSMIESIFSLQRVFYFDNLDDQELINRMDKRGRDEDFEKRIADYRRNSIIVPQYYKNYREDIHVPIDGSKDKYYIRDKIIEEMQLIHRVLG